MYNSQWYPLIISGFTYQYIQLNALIDEAKYPVNIIGFPCNQFGHQEPADNETELLNGLHYVRPGDSYTPKFTLMKKIDVNGVNETSFYTYLKVKLSF